MTRSLGLCALMATGGCTRWQVQSAPAVAAIEEVGDRRARLTLVNGEQVRIAAPRVVGDSVVGYEAPRESGSRRAVATAEVRRVEIQELDGGKTVGAAALAIGGVLLAWLGLVMLIASTEAT